MKKYQSYVILFLIAILAYGLLIPNLGFYWDDLPISWIRYQLGPEALTEYFSAKRPVWSVLYQISASIIPQVAIYWQVFAFVWRWLCAALIYMIVERLWRDRPRMALGVALLYLVYPGFDQHFTAYMYSHFYMVISFFLFSLLCMFKAHKSSKHYWTWTIVGMIFSALNLWMMEYFFLLELTRIVIILIAMRTEKLTFSERGLRSFKLWIPYLTVFILAVVSRIFISTNQDYPMVVLSQLKLAPIDTAKVLIRTIIFDLKLVLRDAWLLVFQLPDVIVKSSQLISYYIVVALSVLVATTGFVLLPRDVDQPIRKNFMDAFVLFGLGLFAVLLSGWPFWLIDYPASLAWPINRFTLSFMFGVSLFFGGILSLIPSDSLRIVILVSVVSFAVGKQYLTAQDYQQDWNDQKDLFWQMTWRAPFIEPDTLVLMNHDGLDFYADNSLSAALNWIYAPDTTTEHIDYVIFFPKTRFRNALPEIEANLPIYFDYIAGEYNGNTSQTLSFYYDPPKCLRLLDPEIERANHLIPENSLMRYAARLTVPELIKEEPQVTLPEVYGKEPEHKYCYYYQKADLARQFGRWDEVLKFSEVALSFSGQPYEPAEQLVFIESYAHDGQWGRAKDISVGVYEYSNGELWRMLCRLWNRIETETDPSPERSEALDEVRSMFACNQ